MTKEETSENVRRIFKEHVKQHGSILNTREFED